MQRLYTCLLICLFSTPMFGAKILKNFKKSGKMVLRLTPDEMEEFKNLVGKSTSMQIKDGDEVEVKVLRIKPKKRLVWVKPKYKQDIKRFTLVSFNNESPQESGALKMKAESTYEMRSSSYERDQRSLGVSARAGNFAGGFYGFGPEGIYNINGDWQLVLNYMFSPDMDLGNYNSGFYRGTATATANIFLAQSRYFVGNSFFFAGGLGARSFDIDMNITSLDASETLNMQTSGTALVGHFGLGNVWNIGGFFIGADWIGYSQPLASLSAEASVSVSGTEVEQEELDNLATLVRELSDGVNNIGSLQLLLLNIGYMF